DHWILTAAHCFLHNTYDQPLTVTAADPSGSATTNVLYSGTALSFRHPSWGGDEDTSVVYDAQLFYIMYGSLASFPNRGLLFANTDYHPWYGSFTLHACWEGFGLGSDYGGTNSCDDAGGIGTLRTKCQVPLDGSDDQTAISGQEDLCGG